MAATSDRYFLGGNDLEMLTIRALLEQHAPAQFEDRGLRWGARASAYLDEIRAVLTNGETPVLIELADDLPRDIDRDAIAIIDHHGDGSGSMPTSLEQVFARLGLDRSLWTRWHDLVAANDRGHIRAMNEIGATREELVEIRSADRRAQGVTIDDEADARDAIAAREVLEDGALTVVRVHSNRTSAVADLIEPDLGGPGARNLLVMAPDELDFFGEGHLIERLNQMALEGAWYGGDLPERGFWGAPLSELNGTQVLDRLREAIHAVTLTPS